MAAFVRKSAIQSVVLLAFLTCGICRRELQALAELVHQADSHELAERSQSAKRLSCLRNPLEVFVSLLQLRNQVAAFKASGPGWKQHGLNHIAFEKLAYTRGHPPAMQGKSLRNVLSNGQPIIVDIQVDDPSTVWDLDVEELSERLRSQARVSAVTAPKALIDMFLKEQARAKGDYPGPVPIFCDVGADDTTGSTDAVKELASQGAAGVMVRCADDDSLDAMRGVITAATAAGLESIVVAGSEVLRAAANEAGATAVACAFPDAAVDKDQEGTSSDGVAIQLGAWDGDTEKLKVLRERGFCAMLLLDGCAGEIKGQYASAWCEQCASVLRSKQNSEFAGMAGSLGPTHFGEPAPPPEKRNPRLWAQSQRQAREMMHESARSRGLPDPKLKRNSFIPGKAIGKR